MMELPLILLIMDEWFEYKESLSLLSMHFQFFIKETGSFPEGLTKGAFSD